MPRNALLPSRQRSSAITRATVAVTLTIIATYIASLAVELSEKNQTTLKIIVGVPVLVLLIWAVVKCMTIPRPSVVKMAKTQDRAERILKRRLRPRKWETALVDAGLSIEKRIDLDRSVVKTPIISKIDPVPLGVELTIRTVSGQSPEGVKKRVPNLAAALNVPFRFKSIGPSTVSVTAILRNPLDKAVEIDELPELDITTMSVPYAVDEDGNTVVWTFAGNGGAIVGGIPGAGKTSAATAIIGPLLASPYAEVHIIDGKGGLDWSWAKPLATSYTNESRDLEAITETVEAFDEAMTQRLLDVPEDQVSNFWDRPRTVDQPFTVLVIDECQTYLNPSGKPTDVKKLVQRIASAVENTTKKGRSAGYFVMLMTQKPTSDSLPTAIRDNCGLSLAFRVRNRAAEESILGEAPDTEDELPRATAIPKDRKGGAVAGDEQGGRRYIRAMYLSEARASQIIKEVAA